MPMFQSVSADFPLTASCL